MVSGYEVHKPPSGNVFIISDGKSTGNVLEIIEYQITLIGCILRGKRHVECKSVNYNHVTKICEVIGKNVISPVIETDSPNWNNYRMLYVGDEPPKQGKQLILIFKHHIERMINALTNQQHHQIVRILCRIKYLDIVPCRVLCRVLFSAIAVWYKM